MYLSIYINTWPDARLKTDLEQRGGARLAMSRGSEDSWTLWHLKGSMLKEKPDTAYHQGVLQARGA